MRLEVNVIISQRRYRGDRALQRVDVLVVVVPRHRRGLVADDGLHDMKRGPVPLFAQV